MMDVEKLADAIELLGRKGSVGANDFENYLRENGRDGDMYMEEGFLQLIDIAKSLGYMEE